MKVLILRYVLGCLALSALVACASLVTAPSPGTDQSQPGSGVAESHGGPVRDHVSFVDKLRSEGFFVEIVDEVQQPFLRARGTRLRITGGEIKQAAEIESYNYDDTDLQMDGAKTAEADAREIGPDGTLKTTRIRWVGPPHFFRKERVIVIYVGDDQVVLKLLTETLGPQFAGR